MALVLKDSYLAHGRFVRADLPAYATSELYADLARALDVERGILVTAVLPQSSAYRAGLREGDVIVETDGRPCSARTRADVLRGPAGARKHVAIKAKLEAMERIPKYGLHAGEIVENRYDALGLGVRQIVTTSRILYALPGVNGVLVSTARPADPAGKAGLKENDIITHVGGRPTPDVATFQRELEAQLAGRTRAIELTVARGKATLATALAPFYGLRHTKVALIVPPKDPEYLDLLRRELLASGASLTVTAPRGVHTGSDYDVILLAGGAGSRALRADADVLRLVGEAAAAKKTLAAVGPAVVALANAIPDIAGKKLTTTKEDSADLIRRKANYTGKAVETDGQIVTTTGFDRATVRAFLKALYRIALNNG